MQLILVRHGETAWNEALRYQGRSDVPLNETGRAQARQLAARLAQRGVTAVYASPLGRAVETAQFIAEPHGLPVQTEPDLREMDFGAWEGRTHAEIDAADGERLAAWWADPLHRAPPSGESLGDVVARVQGWLARLQAAHGADATAVAVSHVGPIKAALFEALQLNLGWHWQVRIDRASLTTLAFTARGAILMGCNDTCHLRA
jgi:alpha-ribazole phosphatase